MAVVDPFERGKMLADFFDRGYSGFIHLWVSLCHIQILKIEVVSRKDAETQRKAISIWATTDYNKSSTDEFREIL
jgi:hypothetical protein